jgi:hypothetical protein
LLARIKTIFNFPLLPLGEVKITLWTLIYFLVLLLILFYLTAKTRKLLVDRVFIFRSAFCTFVAARLNPTAFRIPHEDA